MADDSRIASKHALVRTSPKGGPFFGRCINCGAEGLPMVAVQFSCPNSDRKTDAQTLVKAIRGGFDA